MVHGTDYFLMRWPETTTMTDDASLVDRAVRGDRDALDELFARHIPAVEALVRMRAGPLVRAKESLRDVAQSACREVLGRLDDFRGGGEEGFRRWLLATVMRKITHRDDYHRAARREFAREDHRPVDGTAREQEVLEVYASIVTPSRALETAEELARIERAMDLLPQEDRDLVIKARILGQDREQIAAELGVSEGAARVRLHRALARLSGLLTVD